MSQSVSITSLFIYPVKSCAPVAVGSLVFDRDGPVGDRRFVITTPEGDFLTQREHPQMASIQPHGSGASNEPDATELWLSHEGQSSPCVSLPLSGEPVRVRVWGDEVTGIDAGDEIAEWLTVIMGTPCRLRGLPMVNARRADTKYAPADTGVAYADGFPVLVINQSSLDALSEHADTHVDAARFRANVVVEGVSHDAGEGNSEDVAKGVVEAFSELRWQRLIAHNDQRDTLTMVKPCERCVIPTRDPITQVSTPAVTKALVALCRPDKKILFGQNAVFSGESLSVGEVLEVDSSD